MKKPIIHNNKLKYGGYSTVATAMLIGILIVINLIISESDIKIDLTKNKLFTLSPQTYEILDNIDDNINIYALYETGKENPTFQEIIEKYQSASDKIKVIYKDPLLYPQFTLNYKKPDENISVGSLIVENSSGKYRVIDYYDLVNYSQDNYTKQPTVQSLAVEQRVTSAISYVTNDKNPLIYVMNGHNEQKMSYELIDQLDKENFSIKEINLLSDNIDPKDSNTLLIASPKQDITEEESHKIIKFLESGGRGIFLIDFDVPNLPNFKNTLKRYGIVPQKGVVIEGDDAHKAVQNPIYLLPKMPKHDITSSLISSNIPVLIPQATGLEISKEKQSNTKIMPLLISSNNSWLKTNLTSQTIEKEKGDISGPINIALAVQEKNYEGSDITTTKLVVIGNSYFINPVAVPGNLDFVMNSLNWLQDQKQNISIRPKNIIPERFNISSQKALMIAGFFVIILPLVILGLGLSVWLRRRHL